MFLQKETTFKRELKYFQQFLVSICVIFYLIFFFSVRSEMKMIYTAIAKI